MTETATALDLLQFKNGFVSFFTPQFIPVIEKWFDENSNRFSKIITANRIQEEYVVATMEVHSDEDEEYVVDNLNDIFDYGRDILERVDIVMEESIPVLCCYVITKNKQSERIEFRLIDYNVYQKPFFELFRISLKNFIESHFKNGVLDEQCWCQYEEFDFENSSNASIFCDKYIFDSELIESGCFLVTRDSEKLMNRFSKLFSCDIEKYGEKFISKVDIEIVRNKNWNNEYNIAITVYSALSFLRQKSISLL